MNSYQEKDDYQELKNYIQRQNSAGLCKPPQSYNGNQFISDDGNELNIDSQSAMQKLRKEYTKIISG